MNHRAAFRPTRLAAFGLICGLASASFGAEALPTKASLQLPAPEAPWPKWRRAMSAPNTIYDISDNTIASLTFTFLSNEIPAQFSNCDGAAGTGRTIFGYGGGAHFRGVGPMGVIVFGAGGENFAGNMTGALNLNGDVAHFEVWQQPTYRVKAEPGAEFYWNPKEAEALSEKRKFPLLKFDKTKWDGGFPVIIGGWVYPAPVKYVEPATEVPRAQSRYAQPCFTPAEATGLGTGVWFIPSAHFMAPGFYYGIDPVLCADLWPSGKKKWYAHYQREDTKAWTRISTPVPAHVGPGSFSSQVVGFSAKYKQVIVPLQGPNAETGVFDLSAGVSKGTWSVKPSPKKGDGQAHIRCGQKSAMSNGHPRNRAFFVWYSGNYGEAPNGLNILDLDDPAYPIYALKLPGLKGGGERFGLHYIPALDKFISFGVGGNPAQAFCQKITVPEKLSDTASYKVEDLPLSAAPGVDLTSSYTNSGMVQYLENLNCIVFLATARPAKAFVVK